MRTCSACGSRVAPGRGKCPVCGVAMASPVSRGATPVLQPVRSPVVQPVAGEARKWYPELEQSPVFAHDPGREPTPVHPTGARRSPGPDANPDLEIGIDARFDVSSASGRTDPVVHLLLGVAPNGEPLVDPRSGPVAHVILALDLSASMNHPDKYPVLTRAIEGMLLDLKAPDTGDVLLSIVLFAYGAEVLLRAVPASTLDPRQVLTAIDHSEMRFGRYTDIVGALNRAGRIAYDSHKADKTLPVRVYVLTDGKPQDMDGARSVMETLKKLPVDVDGLAFGDDADVSSLQQLVSGGRGGTVKVVRSDTLTEAFGHIAETAQQMVAKRALVSFDLADGIVGGAAYRFRPARHNYGRNAFEGGRKFEADLGTLESGRNYSLLFQLRLPQTGARETEVGRVTVRVPGHGGPRTYERILTIPRHFGALEPERDATVDEARHIAEAMGNDDPLATLQALKTRRKLYVDEYRDPKLIQLLDKAIAELESRGSLDQLSGTEKAALLAHTCTVGSGRRPSPANRELSFE